MNDLRRGRMSLDRVEVWMVIALCIVAAVTFLPGGVFVVHLLNELARAVGGAP
jgi:hypothetical protein